MLEELAMRGGEKDGNGLNYNEASGEIQK